MEIKKNKNFCSVILYFLYLNYEILFQTKFCACLKFNINKNILSKKKNRKKIFLSFRYLRTTEKWEIVSVYV